MGGVVATSLLPHDNIAAIITMSTPYIFPPARFDRRIESIFNRNRESLASDSTPILSLCGGATDLMVPSESCYLPNTDVDVRNHSAPYRRTIFSSALEGCWTGVGHKEMVWCHQVRWRVARAAIELTKAIGAFDRGAVLDFWLRDGHMLPPGLPGPRGSQILDGDDNTHAGQILVLKNPTHSGRYLLPIPPSSGKLIKFVLYLSQGSISPTAPHRPLSLRATVEICNSARECTTVVPDSLRLLPSPIPGRSFPVPQEGSDESEGVVVYEKALVGESGSVSVKSEGADGRGWVVAGFVQEREIVNDASTLGESHHDDFEVVF